MGLDARRQPPKAGPYLSERCSRKCRCGLQYIRVDLAGLPDILGRNFQPMDIGTKQFMGVVLIAQLTHRLYHRGTQMPVHIDPRLGISCQVDNLQDMRCD